MPDGLPLVEQWFGEEGFAQLDPLLQHLHRYGGTLRGPVTVRYGKGMGKMIGSALARRLGIPIPRPDNLLEVTIYSDARGLHWDRTFNASTVIRSLFIPTGAWPTGMWIERSGAIRVGLRVEVIEGVWHWRLARLWLHGVRIPLWLLPGSAARKEATGNHYRFFVGLSLPIVGTVLSYEGELFAIPSAIVRSKVT